MPSLAPVTRPALMILLASLLLTTAPPGDAQSAGFSLRFHGNGVNAPDQDRVKIQIDDPSNSNPGPPADIGATDFTLEFWMKAGASENTAGAVSCGDNISWINGNIVFDRDRFNQDRKFGLSIAGGKFVFGVSGDGTGDHTICGTSDVLDDQWHHIAVQRRRLDGAMWLYVDGVLEGQEDGPDGDISYPDDAVPGNFCGDGDDPCTNSDPFLVIGAEKHDAGAAYPSYSGWIDEVRLSKVMRYSSNFTRPSQPFTPDADTVGLYHFDEGNGNDISDSSGAAGGPSTGTRNFGGNPAGPEWSADMPPFGGPGVITFQEIATGLANPVAITNAGDGSNRLFIVEQEGRIQVLQPGATTPTIFLDITTLVSSGGEEGLLSVAFHPDYPTTPFFFVYYTDNNGDNVVARYSVSANPDVADPNSGQIILPIPHPGAGNHNGGQLQFGPDGYLYISIGDGAVSTNAQSLNSLLGKILRIDVDAGSPYAIPSDNPFVETPDDPNTLGEIWALGLRNPWRFSFDRVTGDLLSADVGQSSREEVNFQEVSSLGGQNYQWPCKEGTAGSGNTCTNGTPTAPILEYSHDSGCSITGGYRYRGTQFPQAHGLYFYGDYCSGRIWAGSQNGQGDWASTELIDTDFNISSFGEDEAGELYLAHHGGAIHRITNTAIPVTLTVSTAGSGTGTVTSSPPGIECGTGGTDCSEDYPRGAQIMLMADPDPGFILNNWSGDADCADGVVTLNAVTACTANFARGPNLIGQLGQLTKVIKTTTDKLKYIITLQNKGDLPFTGKPLVQVYLSANETLDASDTLVFTKAVSSKKLPPGGVTTLKGKATVPTPSQGQHLILKIDATNLVTESDEGNNLATLPIP